MNTIKKFHHLVEMQEHSCQQWKDRELYGTKTRDGHHWITYQQFKLLVDDLRSGLAALGVQKGDPVAIISNNSVEWATSCYATMGLGGQFVSMYESQKADEWEYILRDCLAKVVLVRTSEICAKILQLKERLPHLQSVILIEAESEVAATFSLTTSPINYQSLLVYGQAHPIPSISLQRSDIMGLIYTSGTTGNPKGVVLSHGNVLFNIEVITSLADVTCEDRGLSFLPWAHIFGQLGEVHFLISRGFSAGIVDNVNTIMDDMAVIRPTLLCSVPRIYNKIYHSVQQKMQAQGGLIKYLFDKGMELANKKRRLPQLTLQEELLFRMIDAVVFKKVRDRFGGRLRFALSGASALNSEVARFVENLGIIVLEGYGLSETSPLVSLNTLQDHKLGTVGKIIPGIKVVIDRSVLDPEDRLQDFEEGEIVVYGPNVMQGYHNLPEETQRVMTADGGFRTGDIGRIDSEGYLLITGRIKEQYKLENGKYVVPVPMEEELKLARFVSQCFIYGSNKPYNVGIVTLDLPTLSAFALSQQISMPREEDILQHPQILMNVEREIENRASHFKSFERPKKYHYTLDAWNSENGLLTPTMKLKRKAIYDHYQEVIESLYH